MIYELKRYKIRSGDQEIFLSVWRSIVKLREKHGFKVLFALFNREDGWFTWAIANDDFEAAATRYYADPDRIALDVIVNYVEDHEIKKVEFIPTT